MFCERCGKKLENYMKFCPGCGNRTSTSESPDLAKDNFVAPIPSDSPVYEEKPQVNPVPSQPAAPTPVQPPQKQPSVPSSTPEFVPSFTPDSVPNPTPGFVPVPSVPEIPFSEPIAPVSPFVPDISASKNNDVEQSAAHPYISPQEQSADCATEKKTQISAYGRPPYYPYPANISPEAKRKKGLLIALVICLSVAVVGACIFFLFLWQNAPLHGFTERVIDKLKGGSNSTSSVVSQLNDTDTTTDTQSDSMAMVTTDTIFDTDVFNDTATDSTTDTSTDTTSSTPDSDTVTDSETAPQNEISVDTLALTACKAVWKDLNADTFILYTIYNSECQKALGNNYSQDDFKAKLGELKEYVAGYKSSLKNMTVDVSVKNSEVYDKGSDKFKSCLKTYKDIYKSDAAIEGFALVNITTKFSYQDKVQGQDVEVYCVKVNGLWYTIET